MNISKLRIRISLRFVVNNSVFINTVLLTIDFKILNIYYSMMGMINIIKMYYNVLIATYILNILNILNIYIIYICKGKISRNQTINLSTLVTY